MYQLAFISEMSEMLDVTERGGTGGTRRNRYEKNMYGQGLYLKILVLQTFPLFIIRIKFRKRMGIWQR